MLNSIKGRFWLWTAAMAAVGLLYLFAVQDHLKVETDILALLPQEEQDAGADRAMHAFSDAIGRKTLFLIGAADPAAAEAAARQFAQLLRAPKLFADVKLEIDPVRFSAAGVYLDHRFGLLSAQHRDWLRQGQGQKLLQEALRNIYNPAVAPHPLPVAQDPLNLYGAFLGQQLTALGNVRLRDSVLAVSNEGMTYVLVIAESGEGSFSMAAQDQLVPVIASATAQVSALPGVSVLASGLLLHAAAASTDARSEINTVGSLSMVGVILMVLLTFRSPLPILLSALALGAGAIAAMTACHYLYGSVHLITLVFGSGLIGVAIDYSTHFLADQFRDPKGWTPAQASAHVGPSIAMGMACAVLGYLGLALAPLPGLRQMAVFSAVGLVVSCSSVLFWYPVLARPMRKPRPPALLRLSDAVDRSVGRLRRWRHARLLVAALAALTLLGLARTHFADDIRLLQSSPPGLLAGDRQVRELLGNTPDTPFFLLRGDSPQAVLEAGEALGAQLDARIAGHALKGYSSLSRQLPSLRMQGENLTLLAQQVYTPQGIAPRLMRELGFPEILVAQRLAEFTKAASQPGLTLEEWLKSDASEPYRYLWLDRIDGGYAGIVTLSGVHDIAALKALDGVAPGVKFIDRVQDISDLLGRYRRIAAGLIACAYSLIGLLMAWRYGLRTALRLLSVPVAAAAATLAFFGLCGLTTNLFNVLGLFLVLGLGVDYAVFLRDGQDARRSTVLAISLSTIGTTLSYGLLALSHTPFIRSIGLSLLLGIFLTYLFALWSQPDAHAKAGADVIMPPHPTE